MLDALNQYIQQTCANGPSSQMYNFFQILTLPVDLLCILWYGYKLKFGLLKSILLFVVGFVALYSWMLVFFWINSGFTSFGGQNMMTVFVHVPIMALGVSKLLKIDWIEECYLHAACMPLLHGIGHFGCMFAGCCSGYPSEWGVFNPRTGTICFPIQLIEATISLSIAAFLFVRSHKNKYKADATQYPLMMVMFGGARFVCEFFRNNEKIFLGCSALSFHALFLFVVGIVWLRIIRVREKRKLEQVIHA